MNLFKRKPKEPAYDYVAHMKALLAITESAIEIAKQIPATPVELRTKASQGSKNNSTKPIDNG